MIDLLLKLLSSYPWTLIKCEWSLNTGRLTIEAQLPKEIMYQLGIKEGIIVKNSRS